MVEAAFSLNQAARPPVGPKTGTSYRTTFRFYAPAPSSHVKKGHRTRRLFTRRTRGVAGGPTRELQAAFELAAARRAELQALEAEVDRAQQAFEDRKVAEPRIVEPQSLLTPSTQR